MKFSPLLHRCLWVIPLFALATGGANIDGVTTDGRPVILKEDGTWEFAKAAPSSTANDFRKAKWGMTKAQVKASESLTATKDMGETILYTGTLASFDVVVGYIFAGSKLVRAAYLVTEEHTNKTDHISDYNSLKELLVKKYGEPAEDKSYWKQDLYRDDPQHWGMALSMGHLVYYTKWETDRTAITMMLTGDNFEISHKIEYRSKNLGALEEKEKEAAAIGDL
jgi:hypothetical protein